MSALFYLSAIAVLPFWSLMIFAPHWSGTRTIMSSPWTVVVPVVIYTALTIPLLGHLVPFFARPTLSGLKQFLGTEVGSLLMWAHVSAFDLIAGRMIYLDSLNRSLPFWVMSPILFVTIFFGPLGFALYLAVLIVFARG